MASTPKKVLSRVASKLYQNSYRLQPKRKLNMNVVRTRISNVMESNLQEVEYSEQAMKELSLVLAEEIKAAVKDEKFDRYRYIVMIKIVQKNMQGFNSSHSFLWDHERDTFVEFTYDTFGFFIQAVVYAVYLD